VVKKNMEKIVIASYITTAIIATAGFRMAAGL